MEVGLKYRRPCRRASRISSKFQEAERRMSDTTEIYPVWRNTIRTSQHSPLNNKVEKRKEQKKSLTDLKVAH